jgi:hypothetical protein
MVNSKEKYANQNQSWNVTVVTDNSLIGDALSTKKKNYIYNNYFIYNIYIIYKVKCLVANLMCS